MDDKFFKILGPGPDNDWSFLKPTLPKSLNASPLSFEMTPEAVKALMEALKKQLQEGRHVFVDPESRQRSPGRSAPFDLARFYDEKAAWSRKTFGAASYSGVLKHLAKELVEVTAKPSDLEEWADIVLLALDGASRHAGATGEEFVAALQAKQQKNLARKWAPPCEDGVSEHDRSEENDADEKSRFEEYLRQLALGRFSSAHVEHLRAVWNLVLASLGPEFALPIACPTEDDGLQLSWTANGRHVSIDMYQEGEGDWFARDRTTGFFEGGQISSAGPLPDVLVEHLKAARRASKESK